METISLSKDPNQSMVVVRDDVQYSLTLRTFSGVVLASVQVDGVDVVNSLPCVRNGWLIPYDYLVGERGNLRFESSSESYPTADGFGREYRLVYYTHDEYVAKKEEEGA